ncbi:zinc-ribbon domain-containing protein [Pseudomonas sp. GD03860]|uniref:DUF3426 domain-containing protein n=1 Tax=Pseudomonas TaxID=286 RepID=UPI0023633E35|nr:MULTISPECIES: DUF3426 domain-containing protein [Pseudomonas]MDD2060198.1 zinc-ribbon domain-containing protein [Pseudomonas putida]MDH0636382.1 zinc-ribbon domain-containing protein [Pseudomonas sp. GD03860]
MTDSFVTQCPHCQTSFRVNHNQLSVARGVVRCGACLQVFNAAKQLLEQSAAQNPASEPAVVEPAPPAPPTPISPREWSAAELDLDQLDLDQELARLEQREIQPTTEFKAGPAREENLSAHRDEPETDDPHWPDSLFSTPANEREAPAEALDEPLPPLVEQEPLDLAPAPGERTEPSLSLEALDDDLDPPAQPTRPLAAELDEPPVERLSAKEPEDDFDAPEADDERREPGLGPASSRPARKEPLLDLVDDPLQLDWQKPKAHWGKRLLWILLILLAAAALAGQYIWYHFDELARQDQYRPWFQQLCPQVGCKVPSRVDIDRIKSSNLVVRSHPDFNGALIVDAIIYNRAPFTQPFPLLELRFADLNGQLIASRRFKPAEYLSGELAGKGEMPSQVPIHIALDILDPGPKAVNYSLSFRSPE